MQRAHWSDRGFAIDMRARRLWGIAALCSVACSGDGDKKFFVPETGGQSGFSGLPGANGGQPSGGVGASGRPSSGGVTATGARGGSGGAGPAATGGASAGAGGKPSGPHPVLTPGVWSEITPPAPGFDGTFGAAFIELAPSDPSTLYVSIDTLGLWKTTDAGSTWIRLGNQSKVGDTSTSYLDSPVRVEVDPGDPKHLYATQGVRGKTLGFWVSRDGGDTWTMPKGFVDISSKATKDVTLMAIDPADFKHILLSSHQAWPGMDNAGLLESKDGGDAWVMLPPAPGWPSGTLCVSFLYDKASGKGNSDTWLVATDGGGFWRTTNAGADWTKVSDYDTPHGGADIYYTKDGTLYSGATPFPLRSKDNGGTWEQLTQGLTYWYYYTVTGDGSTLYTQISYTGDNGGQGDQPYLVSPESDGKTWTPYKGGAQKFSDGPFTMRFDSVNRIMYSANWRAGVWALKVE